MLLGQELIRFSNLRAATGLAAQDYMLHLNINHIGNVGIQGNRRYVVLGFKEDIKSDGVASANNMMVFPSNSAVYQDGSYTWVRGNGQPANPPANGTMAFKVKELGITGQTNGAWTGSQPILDQYNESTSQINGKTVVVYPLQQNKGNARFDIEIGKGGTVVSSRIVQGEQHKPKAKNP